MLRQDGVPVQLVGLVVDLASVKVNAHNRAIQRVSGSNSEEVNYKAIEVTLLEDCQSCSSSRKSRESKAVEEICLLDGQQERRWLNLINTADVLSREALGGDRAFKPRAWHKNW